MIAISVGANGHEHFAIRKQRCLMAGANA
jgi:hypothetical protein